MHSTNPSIKTYFLVKNILGVDSFFHQRMKPRYAANDYSSLFTSLYVHSTNPSIKTYFLVKNILGVDSFFHQRIKP